MNKEIDRNEHIFAWEIKPSYITQKALRVLKRFFYLFPEFSEKFIGKKLRLTKPFTLIYGIRRIPVVLNEQGHIIGVGTGLKTWFDDIKPKNGDVINFYMTDKRYEFKIEINRTNSCSQNEIINEVDKYSKIPDPKIPDHTYRLEISKEGVKIFTKTLSSENFEIENLEKEMIEFGDFGDFVKDMVYINLIWADNQPKSVNIYFNRLDIERYKTIKDSIRNK